MKNCFFLLLLVSAATFGQSFPITKAIPSTITKFNISFQDDYVWLEDMKSETTKNWVNAQNEVCNFHLDEIKKNNNILSKIKEYNAYSSNGLPAKKGAFFYSLYTKENGKPSVLYYRKAINDDAIALFNPFSIYKNSFAGITDYSPSNNSKFMACKISTDGSDRNEIRFVDIEKLKNLDDVLTNVKFSKIVWNQDTGIFYKRNSNQNNFAKDSTFQLFYHKLGTQQENDKLVFDTSKTGNNFNYFTKKNRLFIIEQNRISDIKNYYFIGLNNNDFVIEPFFESDDSKMTYLHLDNDKIYFSNKEFDWGEIKSFDISNPKVETVIVPQIYNNLLLDTYFEEDYIFCIYKTTVKNYIIAYDQNGKFIRKFDSPEGTDFDFKFFDSKTKDLYISVFSKTISFQNFKLNVASGEAKHFYNYYLEPKVTLFPLDYFTTKTTTFKSRDQKEVPITIIYKKGTVLDGKNPTLLEAYGGFGVVSELYYDSALLYFLEKGGVYAFASIRGGGEKGLKWHTDGMGLKKQNTFNDFIDAAEFLISQKYTSPEKLAISGASNGGLVVGVAMTQRPELFKVAVPKVGVFDMIKFKNYTVGSYWAEEYGNPESKAEFESLLAFSPYHNIREEVNYPITLIITSENDDRVVPMHSYKFAAHLQNRTAQKNPIYIKTFNDAGHNGKISNYNSYFEEKAAFYSFLLYHLNK